MPTITSVVEPCGGAVGTAEAAPATKAEQDDEKWEAEAATRAETEADKVGESRPGPRGPGPAALSAPPSVPSPLDVARTLLLTPAAGAITLLQTPNASWLCSIYAQPLPDTFSHS